MASVKACHCCLDTEAKLSKMESRHIWALNFIVGIEISSREDYENNFSLYICVECDAQMNRALEFRKKCRLAFHTLQELLLTKKKITLQVLKSVDRTDLKSRLSVCNDSIRIDIDRENIEPNEQEVTQNSGQGRFSNSHPITFNAKQSTEVITQDGRKMIIMKKKNTGKDEAGSWYLVKDISNTYEDCFSSRKRWLDNISPDQTSQDAVGDDDPLNILEAEIAQSNIYRQCNLVTELRDPLITVQVEYSDKQNNSDIDTAKTGISRGFSDVEFDNQNTEDFRKALDEKAVKEIQEDPLDIIRKMLDRTAKVVIEPLDLTNIKFNVTRGTKEIIKKATMQKPMGKKTQIKIPRVMIKILNVKDSARISREDTQIDPAVSQTAMRAVNQSAALPSTNLQSTSGDNSETCKSNVVTKSKQEGNKYVIKVSRSTNNPRLHSFGQILTKAGIKVRVRDSYVEEISKAPLTIAKNNINVSNIAKPAVTKSIEIPQIKSNTSRNVKNDNSAESENPLDIKDSKWPIVRQNNNPLVSNINESDSSEVESYEYEPSDISDVEFVNDESSSQDATSYDTTYLYNSSAEFGECNTATLNTSNLGVHNEKERIEGNNKNSFVAKFNKDNSVKVTSKTVNVPTNTEINYKYPTLAEALQTADAIKYSPKTEPKKIVNYKNPMLTETVRKASAMKYSPKTEPVKVFVEKSVDSKNGKANELLSMTEKEQTNRSTVMVNRTKNMGSIITRPGKTLTVVSKCPIYKGNIIGKCNKENSVKVASKSKINYKNPMIPKTAQKADEIETKLSPITEPIKIVNHKNPIPPETEQKADATKHSPKTGPKNIVVKIDKKTVHHSLAPFPLFGVGAVNSNKLTSMIKVMVEKALVENERQAVNLTIQNADSIPDNSIGIETEDTIPDIDLNDASKIKNADSIAVDNKEIGTNDTIPKDVDLNDENSDSIAVDNEIEIGTKITVTEEIDLNDVFKGLKEESASELESLPEEVNTNLVRYEPERTIDLSYRKRRDKYKLEKEHTAGLLKYNTFGLSLYNSVLTFLTEEEQKEAFERRQNDEEFQKCELKCVACVRTFNSEKKLLRHAETHKQMEQLAHKCEICKNRYKDEKILLRHRAAAHWYRYDCKVCTGTHYTFNELLHCHVKNQNADLLDPTVVYEEGRQVFTKKLLNQDEIKESLNIDPLCRNTVDVTSSKTQSESTPIQCDTCGLYFSDTQTLAHHIESMHTYRYKCQLCARFFYNETNVINHVLEGCLATEKKGRTYECEVCDKDFTALRALKRHMKCHGFHCNMCGEVLYSLKLLYCHQLYKHGHVRLNTVAELNDPTFLCNDCNVYFCDKYSYYTHVTHVHPALAKTYELGCEVCRILFDTKEELIAHYQTSCFRSGNYKLCAYCDKTLNSGRQYVEHYTRAHPGRPFHSTGAMELSLCHICGKIFYIRIESHLRVHEERYASRCKFCNATRKMQFPPLHIRHILTAHTKLPYTCAICGERFTIKAECRDHILKNHKPAMPYACEHCNRRFPVVKHLRTHVRSAHGFRGQIRALDNALKSTLKESEHYFVYPHMSIDGTLLPREVLEAVSIQVCDFSETTCEPGNYQDYFFFDSTVDPSVPNRTARLRQPKKMLTISEKVDRQWKRINEKLGSTVKEEPNKRKVENEDKKGRKRRRVARDDRDITETAVASIIENNDDVEEKYTDEDTNYDAGAIESEMVDDKIEYEECILDYRQDVDNENCSETVLDEKVEYSDVDTYQADDSYGVDESVQIMDVEIAKDEGGDDLNDGINELMETVLDPSAEERICNEDYTLNEGDSLNEGNNESVEEMESNNEESSVIGQLIEQDGEYFVLAEGMLYRIENSELG